MKNLKYSIHALIMTIVLLGTESFAETKFKKVIKNGKVTYLPVKKVKEKTADSEAKSKSGAAKETKSSKKSSQTGSGSFVLFQSSTCEECRRIRRFFYSNKINYVLKDISLSKKYKFQLSEKTGSLDTPALFKGGKRITNLSKENLMKISNIKVKKPSEKSTATPKYTATPKVRIFEKGPLNRNNPKTEEEIDEYIRELHSRG